MAYNPTYKREKTKIRPVTIIPVILLVLLVVGVSFYGGMLWQQMQNEHEASQGGSTSSSAVSKAEASGASSSAASVSSAASEASTESDESSEESSEPVVEEFEPLIAKTDFAKMSYFDDCVFIGDSVSSGLSYYGVLPEEIVLADTSVNFEGVLYKTPFTDLNGNYVNTFDAVASRDPNKIFIMLGANGIEWIDLDRLMGYYEKLITGLREVQPDSVIIAQSVLPVTATLDQNPNRDLTNAKIDAYNEALYELCKKLEVYYLNVTEVFKDENGCLPEEASPYDGLHFTRAYYDVWLDYLRNHAPTFGFPVPEDPEESSVDTETETVTADSGTEG